MKIKDEFIYYFIRFRSHFTCEYRLPIGKYRAALRHIDCSERANIDLHIVPSSTAAATAVPLLHKARQSRAGEGRCGTPVYAPLYALGSEDGECVGLPQQARAARRRVLYVRNCVTVEHVVARRRAIRARFRAWRRVAETGNRSVNADGRVLKRT